MSYMFHSKVNLIYRRIWLLLNLIFVLGFASLYAFFSSLARIKRKVENFRSLVGVEGLEPSRCYQQRILSPHRLPFRHTPILIGTFK